MATIVHTDWKNGMLGAPTHSAIDFNTDTIKAALLSQTLLGQAVASGFVDYDEVDGGLVGTAMTIPVNGINNGLVTLGGSVTFPSVGGVAPIDYLTVFKDSGAAATSPLAITWDTASPGLPATPTGGNVVATWGTNILVSLG